jgi:hypothetical protein
VAAVLERLAALVRDDGGLLADAIATEPAGATPYGDAVARGPRAAGHAADLPLVLEAVREGYLLHYGAPRLMGREDDDLALLAGDRLYALGLERLAAAGDLDAVAALADLIGLGAQAHAAGDEGLADALWAAGCVEVGWGPSPPPKRRHVQAFRMLPTAFEQPRAMSRETWRRPADRTPVAGGGARTMDER